MKRARIALGRLEALALDRAHVQQNRTVEAAWRFRARRPARRSRDRRSGRYSGSPSPRRSPPFSRGATKRIAPISALANALRAAPPNGMWSNTSLPRSRTKFANGLVRSTERYEAIEPTLGAIDISLSLRITMKFVLSWPALLIASYARPPVSAPSPITATTVSSLPPNRAPSPCRGRRDRRGRVTGAELIVRRLAAHREARDAAAFAQGVESVAPPGQHLVDVRLVATSQTSLSPGSRARDAARASVRPRRGSARDGRRCAST